MEKGDLTAMRYSCGYCDYFICFHVLEHVPDDETAVKEIFRVLKPKGQAILQVPIDKTLQATIEYGKPNPLETGHVRRYSDSGFSERLSEIGFIVSKVSVDDLFTAEDVLRYGFNRDPIYFAQKPS
jgi:ubiquinone/menaquinone biosynthesis C-methylase UbiE